MHSTATTPQTSSIELHFIHDNLTCPPSLRVVHVLESPDHHHHQRVSGCAASSPLNELKAGRCIVLLAEQDWRTGGHCSQRAQYTFCIVDSLIVLLGNSWLCGETLPVYTAWGLSLEIVAPNPLEVARKQYCRSIFDLPLLVFCFSQKLVFYTSPCLIATITLMRSRRTIREPLKTSP